MHFERWGCVDFKTDISFFRFPSKSLRPIVTASGHMAIPIGPSFIRLLFFTPDRLLFIRGRLRQLIAHRAHGQLIYVLLTGYGIRNEMLDRQALTKIQIRHGDATVCCIGRLSGDSSYGFPAQELRNIIRVCGSSRADGQIRRPTLAPHLPASGR